MEITNQSIAELLVRLVTSSPEQLVLGAKLGGLLKAECPGFSPAQFHSRNLRQFIRTHVPEIVEKGRSGPDFYYGLASAVDVPSFSNCSFPSHQRNSRTTFDWKAFSNPSYPFVLTANKVTGQFQTRTQGAPTADPWVTLPKPSPDEHLKIARDFVQTLTEPARSTLEQILTQPMWYSTFSARARNCGVVSEWASFRTSRLRGLFDRALADAGIPRPPERPVSTSVSSMAPDRAANPASQLPIVQRTVREEALRKLVLQVVAEMPLSDLRNLALPIGKVIDHIDEFLK